MDINSDDFINSDADGNPVPVPMPGLLGGSVEHQTGELDPTWNGWHWHDRAKRAESLLLDIGEIVSPTGEWPWEAIEQLPEAVKKLDAALMRVQALHMRIPDNTAPKLGFTAPDMCRADGETWPCPTIAALDGP